MEPLNYVFNMFADLFKTIKKMVWIHCNIIIFRQVCKIPLWSPIFSLKNVAPSEQLIAEINGQWTELGYWQCGRCTVNILPLSVWWGRLLRAVAAAWARVLLIWGRNAHGALISDRSSPPLLLMACGSFFLSPPPLLRSINWLTPLTSSHSTLLWEGSYWSRVCVGVCVSACCNLWIICE